jgi:pilus assembly protein CpaB
MNRRKILLLLAAMIAALGTLLVWIWVQGAEGRAKEEFEAVEVLVAQQDIEQGESFEDAASKFALEEVPENSVLDGAQTSLDGLEGLVALTPIYDGEQVIAEKWGGSVDITASVLAIPEDKVAASVNLTDPARVAGFVNPGSEVAILVSVDFFDNDLEDYTRTLLSRVTVLGVGGTSTITSTKTSKEGESTTEEIPQTLMTVAVTQKEAEKLFWGASFGELSFALVTKDSKLTKTGPVQEPNLFR